MQGNTELKRGVLHVTMLQCMLQCQDARSLVSSSQNLLPINSSLLPLPHPLPFIHPLANGKRPGTWMIQKLMHTRYI